MNNAGDMFYNKRITEEIHIRIVDRKTAFAAKMLCRTIYSILRGLFDSRIHFFNVEFTVNGECMIFNNMCYADERLYRYVKTDSETLKPVVIPDDSKEMVSLLYLLEKSKTAREISLKAYYYCESYSNDEIGLDVFSEVLEAIDCGIVRKNITYKCMESDEDTESIITYCYDRTHCGCVRYTDDISAVRDVNVWEFNFSGIIESDLSAEDEDNALADKDKVKKIVKKITPYAAKYGVKLRDSTPDCMVLEGVAVITGEKLDEFLDDLHSVNSVLKSYNLTASGNAYYLVSREYGRFAVVSFDVDEEGNTVREYRRF